MSRRATSGGAVLRRSQARSGVAAHRPNQVWASDLTYLPMAHGFLYLMAIMRNPSVTATSPIQRIVVRTSNALETLDEAETIMDA